eukprot:TRINITY_DN122101_c0_g1_i1.p1 TRINITY_DN122101_c0_g1~~TRINITY_DN122101_c0_g1_i1.p1  ORF type:complete len:718 (+),score=117.49 TRINITY_DN122101_c0_g1_i1:162-2315(+)
MLGTKDVERAASMAAFSWKVSRASEFMRTRSPGGADLRCTQASGQSAASVSQELAAQLDVFRQQREEDAQREFILVFSRGMRQMALSLMALSGSMLVKLLGVAPLLYQILRILGLGLLSSGVLACSTCPILTLKIDMLVEDHPKVHMFITVAAIVYFTFMGIRWRPHLGLLVAFCFLLAGLGEKRNCVGLKTSSLWAHCCACITLMTTSLLWWPLLDTTAERMSVAEDGARASVDVWLPYELDLLGCSMGAIGVVAHFAMWLWLRWSVPVREDRDNAWFFVFALHIMLSSHSAMMLSYGVLGLVAGDNLLQDCIFMCCQGTCYAAPPLVMLIVGPERAFQMHARRLAREARRAKRDGAFIASLLDTQTVVIGQRWWVYQTDPAMKRMQTTASKAMVATTSTAGLHPDWFKGRVIEVDESSFAVRLDSASRRCFGDIEVPITSHHKPVDELMLHAEENLRCIDYDRITLELMTGAICGAAGGISLELYDLSRPLRHGETIDFFMSHSWHDDPHTKFEKIQTLATEFKSHHGRYPTFWLDKVCIDQSHIADGLRVLPINVMACSHLLVLCGETYPTRLWCIWEMFVLLAFLEESRCIERLLFVPLGLSEKSQLERLQAFDIAEAHCFDPNEESRLRTVIKALGRSRFNHRIRTLATQLQKDFEATQCRITKASRSSSLIGGGVHYLRKLGLGHGQTSLRRGSSYEGDVEVASEASLASI